MTDWIEIAVSADHESVESVAELLRQYGQGVAIEEPFIQPRLDEAPERDPTRRAIVKTYVLDGPGAAANQKRIEESLWHLSQLRAIDPVQTRRIPEEDWAN
ncbi:MAG: ribosomal protein methyltransferase, partial [Chloroflexi bacterium]|nr:ribosomal protein methyltransferase [Chloroflexota bacterium]